MSHSPRGDLRIGTHAPPPGYRGRRTCFSEPVTGYMITMTDDRTGRRAAELLPEERAAGSADPQSQAEAILAESDEREADPSAAPDSFVERRRSDDPVHPAAGAGNAPPRAPGDGPAAPGRTTR